jgi:hypothetical protein
MGGDFAVFMGVGMAIFVFGVLVGGICMYAACKKGERADEEVDYTEPPPAVKRASTGVVNLTDEREYEKANELKEAGR